MRLGSAFRYLLASATSFCISLGGPILLHEGFAISPALAVAVCFGITFVVNFLVTKYFVYRSAGPVRQEFAAYAATNLMFRGTEYACFSFFYLVLGVRYFMANFVVVTTSMGLKYLVYNYFVYARRQDQPSV